MFQLRTRAISMGAVALLLTWLVALSAGSAPGTPIPSGADTPTKKGKLVLVMDSSGSMKEPSAGGASKIQVAKQALNQVITELPDPAQVGLRVYGAKVFSRSNPRACTDSQLVVPVSTDNRADLRAAVGRYRPFGETPIGYALQEAGKDLGHEGHRSIVLVSDGEPTCAPDPCKAAAQLAKKGVDLKIDVVGLDVSGKARAILQCIASKGHGTYYDADSADDLTASLTRLATRAFRPFAVTGEPVTGTPTPDSAPELTAGEQYVDIFGDPDQPKHYLLSRRAPGSTLYVGAGAQPGVRIGQFNLQLSTLEGQKCASETGTSEEFTNNRSLISTGVSSFNSNYEECATADQLVVAMTQKSFGDETFTDAPFELTVSEEPPVEDAQSLPQAAKRPSEPQPWKPGSAKKGVVAGIAFNDAPLIEPGSYRSSLLPGEVQFYKVHVEWGQQLVAQVDVVKPSAKLGSAIGPAHGANLTMYSPERTGVLTAGDSRFLVDQYERTKAVSISEQVQYNNREIGFGTHPERAGDYYVAVSFDPDLEKDSDTPFLLPFTLSVKAVGSAIAGPTYVMTSETSGPSPDASATPSSTPSERPGHAAAQADDGPSIIVPVGIAVLVLVGIALGWVYLRKSKAT